MINRKWDQTITFMITYGIYRDVDEHLLGAVTQEDLEVQQLLADNVEQALQEQQQQQHRSPTP